MKHSILKTILCVLLTAACAGSLFAGCGKSAETENEYVSGAEITSQESDERMLSASVVTTEEQTTKAAKTTTAKTTTAKTTTAKTTAATTATAKTEKQTARLAAYAAEVERRQKTFDGVIFDYAIFDLDHDGTPELLINYGPKYNESKTDIYRLDSGTNACRRIGTIDGRGLLYAEPQGNVFYNDVAFHGHATVEKCVLRRDSVSETKILSVAYMEDFNGDGEYDPDYNLPYKQGNTTVEFQPIDEKTPAAIRARTS